MSKETDPLVLINKFFTNENGRDKFNKIIQHGSKYIAYSLLTQNPKANAADAAKWNTLSNLTRDCRKILRLFKSLNEVEKLLTIYKTSVGAGKQITVKQTLTAVNAGGLFFYWLFDNFTYFVRGGMIANDPNYARISMFGWFVAIVASAVQDGITLSESLETESRLRSQLALPASGTVSDTTLKTTTNDSEDQSAARRQLAVLLAARYNLYLNMLKNAGDGLVAARGFDLDTTLFGVAPDEGTLAIAGVVAGVAQCIQVYNSL